MYTHTHTRTASYTPIADLYISLNVCARICIQRLPAYRRHLTASGWFRSLASTAKIAREQQVHPDDFSNNENFYILPVLISAIKSYTFSHSALRKNSPSISSSRASTSAQSQRAACAFLRRRPLCIEGPRHQQQRHSISLPRAAAAAVLRDIKVATVRAAMDFYF